MGGSSSEIIIVYFIVEKISLTWILPEIPTVRALLWTAEKVLHPTHQTDWPDGDLHPIEIAIWDLIWVTEAIIIETSIWLLWLKSESSKRWMERRSKIKTKISRLRDSRPHVLPLTTRPVLLRTMLSRSRPLKDVSKKETRWEKS